MSEFTPPDYLCKITVYSGSIDVCRFITGLNPTEQQAANVAGELVSMVMRYGATGIFNRNHSFIVEKVEEKDGCFILSDKSKG